MSSKKQKSSTLQRSQSAPNITSPSKPPTLKRCRTIASPIPLFHSASDGELDDPYALPGGASLDPEKKKSPEKKIRKNSGSSEIFSPLESFQGQNRETLDEFTYLLDGVQDTHPLSVRHSSLLNLVTLLSEPHAFRLLCLNGSFELIFSAILCNLEDPLFRIALLTTAFLAVEEKTNCRFLGEAGAKFLLELATSDSTSKKESSEPAFSSVPPLTSSSSRLKKGKPVSKRQRNSSSLGSVVRELDFLKVVNTKQWQAFTTEAITHKTLALWTLVKGVEDSSFRSILTQIGIANALLPLIHSDACCLVQSNHCSSASSSLSGSGLQSGDSETGVVVQDRLRHHLTIFEHLAHDVGTHDQLLTAHENKTNTSSCRPLVSVLLDLLHSCNNNHLQQPISTKTTKPKIVKDETYVSSILLLLVNLTNKSECGCQAVCMATHKEGFTLIQVLVDLLANARSRYEMDSNGMYDTITTALGVLINLVESSASSRQQLLASRASLGSANAVKFLAEWFVTNDRSYQASITKAKFSPEKRKKPARAPRVASCLSPSSSSSTSYSDSGKNEYAPDPFESTSTSTTAPNSFKRSSSSLHTLSDNEIEEESLVLENQMIACYLSVILGFLISNLPEKRKHEVLQHLPNSSAKGLTDKLKEFLVIQSDASMLLDDTLESIMGIIDTLNNAN